MMRNAVVALIAGAVVTASAPAQHWAEKMVQGSVSHDFGTVARGALLSHKFTFKNIYAVRMEITSVKSGCGCVTATPEKRILEPRESTVIEVRMDARRFSGPKTVGVRITVGPEFISSAELKVTANSRTDIVFNPGQVSFGTVTRGQTPTQAIDVEYAGRLAWQVSEVVAREVPYTVTFKEMYRREGQVGYRLFVTLRPDAPMGTHRHDLYLKTNDPASPLVPVLVEANVQSPVTVTPETLSLGPVKTDTALIRRVVVRGSRPFRILGVDGLANGIDLGAALSEREEMVQFVTFRCQPAGVGPFRHEVKIRTSLQPTPVVVTIDGVASK